MSHMGPMEYLWCSCCSQPYTHSLVQRNTQNQNKCWWIFKPTIAHQDMFSYYDEKSRTAEQLESLKSVWTYITLDNVGFLGQIQQDAVRWKEIVGADAPVTSHAGNCLGFLSQGDWQHIQWCMILGLYFFIVFFVFTLWRYKQEITQLPFFLTPIN